MKKRSKQSRRRGEPFLKFPEADPTSSVLNLAFSRNWASDGVWERAGDATVP